MKNYICILIILGFFITNCTQDKNPITGLAELSLKNDTLSTIAQLNWEGEYEWDGCGFIFEIDEKKYKAINEEFIDEEYKVIGDSTPVWLKYINLNKKQSYYCGDLPYSLEYSVIEILSIEHK